MCERTFKLGFVWDVGWLCTVTMKRDGERTAFWRAPMESLRIMDVTPLRTSSGYYGAGDY